MSQELFDDAVRLEEAGENEHALAVWRQLAEIKPTCNVYLRLGTTARDLGLIEEAERAFKRSFDINGRSAIALHALGSMALGCREYSAAIDYLKKAVK